MMEVKFFSGRNKNKAYRSNSEKVAAIRIARFGANGYMLEMDRFNTHTEVAAEVVKAMQEKWVDELKKKPRPREMSCTGWSPEHGQYTYIHVVIVKQSLEEWKGFFREQLANEESWRWYGLDKP